MDRDERSAKFWIDPIGLARNHGFARVELTRIERVLIDHEREIVDAWFEFF
ncbi:MAG: DUF4160 domain-containing protein [Planctomycetota bacterium]